MVRSMWLLLELLWQNCCHHPVDTKKPRGHVIPWPLPRSPLSRTTTGQKRERPNKLCVFPYSQRPLCVSSSLCTGFYSTGMYLCMIVVVIIVVENGGICLFVYSRERPNKLCIFPTSNPCAFPAAWAQDLILRECLHACGMSASYRETPSMLCLFLFWFDWWW